MAKAIENTDHYARKIMMNDMGTAFDKESGLMARDGPGLSDLRDSDRDSYYLYCGEKYVDIIILERKFSKECFELSAKIFQINLNLIVDEMQSYARYMRTALRFKFQNNFSKPKYIYQDYL